MSVRTNKVFPAEPARTFWIHAVEAGLIAGLIFGLWFQFTMGSLAALGTVYELGRPAVSFPWFVHLLHSVLFAVLFAVAVDSEALREYASRPLSGAVVGAVFGVVLWAVILAIFQPFWAAATTTGAGPIGVFGSPRVITAYLLWGLLVGGLFPQLRRL